MTDLILQRDYQGIIRQDSSFEVRNKWRSGWGLGENLWNVDVNNNWEFVNWWSQTDLYNYRFPKAPWTNNPVSQRFIDRSGGGYGNWLRFQGASGLGDNLPPFPGAKVYSQADRLVVLYTGSAWKPLAMVKHYRPGIEIAMFAHYPHAGEMACSYVATEKFTIYSDSPGGADRRSRFRANRHGVSVRWYKNGTQVGTANFNNLTTKYGLVSVIGNEVTFEKGDVLTVRAPSPLMGCIWFAITFIGKVIQE